MPTYHIEMMEGRTVEQKKKLVEGNHPRVGRGARRYARDGGHPHHRCEARKLGHRRQALDRTFLSAAP